MTMSIKLNIIVLNMLKLHYKQKGYSICSVNGSNIKIIGENSEQ